MSTDALITPTTELEAVNQMLGAIGESPIDGLDDNTLTEAVTALTLLRMETKGLLMKGWSFNTDEDVVLQPADDGTIPLPANLLAITFTGNDKGLPLTRRQGKVYDRKKQTFTIGRPVTATLVVALEYEDIPEGARRFVMISAARKLQDRELGDGALHQFNENDEQRAWADFLGRETDDADYNINRDSPSVRSVTSLHRRSRY